MKLDASKITDYNASVDTLERHILFWILAAGKKGSPAAESLYKIDCYFNQASIFEAIRTYINTHGSIAEFLKSYGIGCFNNKANFIKDLVFKNLNLQTCTLQQLQSVYGIGPKTARCFILHTRKDAQCAGLDTHILKFLRSKGIDAPKSTPPEGKKYQYLQQQFLSLVPKDMSPAEFDLQLWNYYSGNA